MKARFEPDTPSAKDASSREASGFRPQQTPAAPRRFVVDPNQGDDHSPSSNQPETSEEPIVRVESEGQTKAPRQEDLLSAQDPSLWRQEVAARVNRYRARRRTRAPRYPSLLLKFEPPQPVREFAVEPSAPPPQLAAAVEHPHEVEVEAPVSVPSPPETAKIIEFPRPWIPPQRPLDELAEPIVDRPRILEAPDVVPPPPALGGIMIEPPPEPLNEKRPGFEIPLQSADMSRRLMAASIDGFLILATFAAFAYVFFRIVGSIPPLQLALGATAGIIGLFWAAYQYAMLVYSGTTPGLSLARLELSRFDGNPVPRSLRRWRALASILSGLSLGLGYAWCFLDEDRLCWHDRITRTYMAPKPKASATD